MAAGRKRSTARKRDNRDQTAAPFRLDELAKLVDIPATATVPRQVATGLAEPRLQLHARQRDFDLGKRLQKVRGAEGAWEARLPAGVALGLPGRTAERLERSAADVPNRSSSDPFRPAWSPQVHQARPTSASAFRPSISRINGTVVEPYYGIYAPDDRQVYWPASYPWQCVGRIFTWDDFSQPYWAWSGSGVLVGPRHVLTAGHVAPWGSGNWAMLFVPAYWSGASALGAGCQSWVSDYRGWNTGTVAAHDISVLRLYDPIGPWVGWMGTKTYDDDWEGGNYWTLAGYPGDIAGADRPSEQSGIPVLDDDGDGDATELEHHGDSSPGDSGGPFFGFWNDGPYAVGTVSGGERISGGFLGIGDEDNNINAGGRAMVDLVLWAQANWP